MAATATFNGMKCRLAGNSGLWLSEVGLGMWKWGDPSYDGARIGDHEGFKVLDRALELGIFHWDTACSYNMGAGNSERLLGRYFASRGSSIRDKVILATKVANSVRPEHVLDASFTPNQRGASRVYLRKEVENCLQRMQTDRLDLLYLHSPAVDGEGNYTTPLDETWGAMDDLVSQGKINYLGVSNHTAGQLEEVQEALKQVGKDVSRRIVVIQNRYNMVERAEVTKEDDGNDEEFLCACDEQSVSVVPFFPLASGLLTGRYRRANLKKAQGRIIDDGAQSTFLTKRNLDVVEGLLPIARRKGISLAQLAIAWLLAKPQVASVIAGVTKVEQLEDNAKAHQVELTEGDLARIETVLTQPARRRRK